MNNLMLRRRVLLGLLNEEYIIFADPAVEQICATNWGDGIGLKPSQAARVTNSQLGTTFKNNTDIVSFNELIYFTGITQFSRNSFEGASSLVSITLPPNLTYINQYSFRNNSSLAEVTFTRTISCAGNNFLSGMGALTRINIPSIESWMSNSWTGTSHPYSAAGSSKIHAYLNDNNTEITSFTTPSTITSIKDYTFGRWSGITSVVIASTVTSVGKNAFYGCTALKSVTFPESLTTISSYAFSNCAKLEGNIILPNVGSIGDNAFSNCTSITNIYAPSSRGTAIAFNNSGDRTGILVVNGINRTTNTTITPHFKYVIITGNISSTATSGYFMRGPDVDAIWFNGNLSINLNFLTTASDARAKLKFCELGGTFSGSGALYSQYVLSTSGCIVHLAYEGIACTSSNVKASYTYISKIYVGPGESQDGDQAILDAYLADTDWAEYSSKLDLWYNYDGEYKTPPTIPT